MRVMTCSKSMNNGDVNSGLSNWFEMVISFTLPGLRHVFKQQTWQKQNLLFHGEKES